MGFHPKAVAFVVFVSLISPSTLLYTFSRLSLTWNVAIAAIGAYILATYTYPFFTDPLRDVAHPPETHFIFGNGLDMITGLPASNIEAWSKTIPNKGLICWREWFHRRSIVLVTSLEGLREVLLDKPYDYVKPKGARRFLTRILGDGLIVTEGQVHKTQRKLVTPAFSGHHIQELCPLFWQKAQQFADVIEASLQATSPGEKRSGKMEIGNVVSRATLDIIGVAALGRDFRTLENSDDKLAKFYEEITDLKTVPYFIANMLLPSSLVEALPWSENTRFKDATEGVHHLATNLVLEKRETLKHESESHKDILSVLLRSPAQLTDDVLAAQLLTFLAAGHETTSSALTWAVYLLAVNPEIQERVREDVYRTYSSTYAKEADRIKLIDAMPFLTGVCNETLRLYPTVPATRRQAIRPTTLLGHEIRVDTDVLISPWVINRDPSLWGPDADEFKPQRWMEGDHASTGGAKHPLAFITFLHGPRSCIGQGFARSELRYLLAALLLRFKWEMANPNEEVVRAGGITIKPKGGLKVRMTVL